MAAPAERGGLGGRAAAAGGRGVRQDMMERPGAVRPGGSGSLLGSITWSDLRGVLESSSRHYLHIRQHHGPSAEFFSCPDGEKVQTCGERIVLFVLNCLVCGFVEGGDSENGVCFLPHSAGELAKIFWHHGEAVAFYTYKKKGSLCDKSSQCYLLPVLDTIYVQKKWRRHGFGIAMLLDFCQTFVQESCLGISSPLSSEMYHVCGRFLADNHKEQDRLWEVDPPGDWSQRTNIWLQIQLGETPVIKNCPAERISEHKHGKIPAIQGQGDSDRESTVPAADDTSTICSTQQLSKRKENQVEQVGDTKKSKIC
ncbi:protein FAM169B-like isoform X3 [Dendropsophus ebraccatus]|uniref:protein FAM169B-like isoform X3 n=1 Tax=Dendropsophus ebraccatus TaxID=150705 RepID=UPI0038314CC3